MSHNVEILRSAQKQLGRIDRQWQDRIIETIEALADDPRPKGCKKLTGRDAWRIRIGNFRVIYEIHDGKLLVIVVDVGHRQSVYKS